MPYGKRAPTYKRKRTAAKRKSTKSRFGGRKRSTKRTSAYSRPSLKTKKKTVKRSVLTQRKSKPKSTVLPLGGVKNSEIVRCNFTHHYSVAANAGLSYDEGYQICEPFRAIASQVVDESLFPEGTIGNLRMFQYFNRTGRRRNGMNGNWFDEIKMDTPLDPLDQEFTISDIGYSKDMRTAYKSVDDILGKVAYSGVTATNADFDNPETNVHSAGYEIVCKRYAKAVVHSADLEVVIMRYPWRNMYVANPQMAWQMTSQRSQLETHTTFQGTGTTLTGSTGITQNLGGFTTTTADDSTHNSNYSGNVLSDAAGVDANEVQLTRGQHQYMKDDFSPSFAPSGDVIITTQIGFDRQFIGRSSKYDMAGIGKVTYLDEPDADGATQILCVDDFHELAKVDNKRDHLKYFLNKGGPTTKKVVLKFKYDVRKDTGHSAWAHIKALDTIDKKSIDERFHGTTPEKAFYTMNKYNRDRQDVGNKIQFYRPGSKTSMPGTQSHLSPSAAVARIGMVPESNFNKIGPFSVTYNMNQYLLCSEPLYNSSKDIEGEAEYYEKDMSDGDAEYEGEIRTNMRKPDDMVHRFADPNSYVDTPVPVAEPHA